MPIPTRRAEYPAPDNYISGKSGLITCSRCREEVHYDASNYIDGLTFYCERCRWDEVLYSGYDLGRTW